MYTFKKFQPFLTFIFSFISFCHPFEFDGSSSSYAKFASWVPCQNGSISFEFNTPSQNALLFYTDGGENSDYYELKIVDGLIHLRFRINNEVKMLSMRDKLHDNEWHTVDIIRNARFTTLKVDNKSYTREIKNYDPSQDTLGTNKENFVFIGGLPIEYNDRLSELSVSQVIFEPRLRGSVRNIFFSNCGKAQASPTMLDSEGIIMQTDECLQKNPCKNDGICITRDNGVQCDCSRTEYTGKLCEIERQPVEVMFHGAQYLMYDLTNNGDTIYGSNDILNIHFKTTHMNGLIFYTGENKDYLTVSLKNGAIHIAMELGSGGYSDVVDMNGYKLDDGQWHHLTVTRKSRQINIEIDGAVRATGTTMGEFTMLSSKVLYLGGSPHTAEIPGSRVRSNFRGCMKQVVYNQGSLTLDIIELANAGNKFISVVGDVAFGKCEKVAESHPITFTTPASYIALPKWDVRKKSGTISFQFQTTEANGLLMYNGGKYGSSNLDFFALEIIDGYFYLILDLGTGAIKEKVSRKRVDDGNPHLVHFEYKGKKGFIRIDAHQTDYNTHGPRSQLDLEELLFVGGLDFERHNSYRLPKEVWSGVLRYGFVGCLQDLIVNNNNFDLMTIARRQSQRDIVSNCQRSESKCLSQPCMHKGICTEGWNRYMCDCRATGYTGTTCDQVAATLSFNEAQYVLVTLPEESFTEVEDISLRFRTIRAGGILFMTASSIAEDSIELYLERGACKLTVSMGSRSKTLSIGHALNDDQWHTVFVKRRGLKMELRVDSSRPVTDIIPHIATTVRINQIVLGSVGPMLSGVVSGSNNAMTFDDDHTGINIQNDERIEQHTGFNGAMQQFIFNGNHYFDMAQMENVENIEITARFDNGESDTRDPVTFESRDAYVILPQLQAHKHFTFYFKFKTSENTGLILFNGRVGHDFLSLEIYQGYLYYIYNMGGGSQRIKVFTPQPLNDNKWHDVSLLRLQTEEQHIRVDNNPPTIENMKDYSARQFDLMGPLYLGGVVKTLYNSLPEKVLSKYGYLGCIASLDVNGYTMNILQTATLVEHSVVNGCSSSEVTCHASSCYNGGRCIQQWNSYECDCDMTSFTGHACTDESVTYKFGLNRGIVVFEHAEDTQPSTNIDYLAFGFKTIQDYAALVRVDSADSDDYIEMELTEGNVFVVYNMGQEDIPIGEVFHKVNDGKYHVIKFVRSGANATIQVDNWNRAYKYPVDTLRKLFPDLDDVTGKQMSVFNNQARVWIGGKKDSAGDINNAFHGTMSGFVFNGMRIMDLLKEGDPRTTLEGDVRLLKSPRDEISPPSKEEIESEIGDTDIQSTQGHKDTTPKQRVTDDIIFSSGGGPADCYNDDEDACQPNASGTDDDIITPTIVVTRMPTPSPEPGEKEKNKTMTNPIVLPPADNLTTHTYPQDTNKPNNNTYATSNPGETKNKKDNGHFNIFLIIGIVAGVLVAMLILMIALYKFRTRDEGSYRVDESQNFAYLEAKKQQSNGSAVNNVGNGKAGGKKKDVKEWYV